MSKAKPKGGRKARFAWGAGDIEVHTPKAAAGDKKEAAKPAPKPVTPLPPKER